MKCNTAQKQKADPLYYKSKVNVNLTIFYTTTMDTRSYNCTLLLHIYNVYTKRIFPCTYSSIQTYSFSGDKHTMHLSVNSMHYIRIVKPLCNDNLDHL